MIIVIARFKLYPGITREQALDDIKRTIPIPSAQADSARKRGSLDPGPGEGMSVYLRKERASDVIFA